MEILPVLVLIVFFILPVTSVLSNAVFALPLFGEIIQNSRYLYSVINSITIAFSTTTLTLILCIPISLAAVKNGKKIETAVKTLMFFSLFLPPFIGGLGLRKLLGRYGPVNLILMKFGAISEPIDFMYDGGIVGVIFAQTLHAIPVTSILLINHINKIDGSLLEAAKICGNKYRSKLNNFFKILIPLLRPALFSGGALTFIGSLADLGTPLVFYVYNTLPVVIYEKLDEVSSSNIGYIFIFLLTAISLSLYWMASKVTAVHSVTTSKTPTVITGFKKSETIKKYFSFILLFVTIFALFLPHIMVFLIAVKKSWMLQILPTAYSADNFIALKDHPLPLAGLKTSFILSSVSSFFDLILGLSVVTAAIFSKKIKFSLDTLYMLPLAVPGLIVAFSYLTFFKGTVLDARIYPVPLLIIGYAVRRFPYMVTVLNTAKESLSYSLIEASFISGANKIKTFRKIIFPLLLPSIVSGVLMCFIFAFLEVSESMLLAMKEEYFPLTKVIYYLMGRPDGPGLAAALGVISLLIMIFIVVASNIGVKFYKSFPVVLLVLLPATSYSEPKQLVLVSPHWEGARYEFEDAFKVYAKKNKDWDVSITWLSVGATSEILRYIISEFSTENYSIGVDMMVGGGTDPFEELKRRNLLANFIPKEISKIPENCLGSPLHSTDNTWHATAITSFGILCNTTLSKKLNIPLPTKWRDLINPIYKDQLLVADLRKSGSIHTAFEAVLQGFGWQDGWSILFGITKNLAAYVSNSSIVPSDIGEGNVLCGLSIDSYAWSAINEYGKENMSFVLPKDGPVVNGDGVAILKGAKNKEVAEEFFNFILSEAGQKLWLLKKGSIDGPKKYELGRLSVRPDLYDTIQESDKAIAINPFKLNHSIVLDPAVGSKRWNTLNELIGKELIEKQMEISSGKITLNIPNEL